MPTVTPADETAEAVIACCSFCFKPNTDVERLVAGPAVYVCNECVDLCCQVIAATPEGPVTGARMMPWDHAQTSEAALAHLPNVARAQAQVEEALLGWVLRARRTRRNLGPGRRRPRHHPPVRRGDATPPRSRALQPASPGVAHPRQPGILGGVRLTNDQCWANLAAVDHGILCTNGAHGAMDATAVPAS